MIGDLAGVDPASPLITLDPQEWKAHFDCRTLW